MISIFCQYSGSWMRHWDGWSGIIYMPGSQSNLDVKNQGYEHYGPLKDNSVEILHCNPPPLYKGLYGALEVDTNGGVYLNRSVRMRYGGGDNYYLTDTGISMFNQSIYFAEYSNEDFKRTSWSRRIFTMTDQALSSQGLCALGTLQIDQYIVKNNLDLYTGSLWGHYEMKGNSCKWVVDGNTTGKSDDYYWSGTLFRRFYSVGGEFSSMSSSIAMLRAKTYQAIHDPEPIGLRWTLFKDIMDQLDTNVNTIANVKDIIDALKTLKKYGPIGLVKSIKDAKSFGKAASDAWLTYRYGYSTTKMDIAEYKRAIRTLNKAPVNTDLVYHSRRDGYNMTVRLQRKLPKGLDSIVQKFRSLGIDPNAENLWDLVPFSFVVDWFIPLGDMFHDVGKEYYFDESLYDFQCISFSHQYRALTDIGEISLYTRDVSIFPPEMLWYSEPKSSKSVLYHIVDGVSLLIGRKE